MSVSYRGASAELREGECVYEADKTDFVGTSAQEFCCTAKLAVYCKMLAERRANPAQLSPSVGHCSQKLAGYAVICWPVTL